MNKKKMAARICTWISSKLNICIIVLYILAVLLCLFVPSVPSLSSTTADAEVLDISDSWFYHLQEGRYSLPAYAKKAKPEKNMIYQITTTLPNTLPKDYAIMFTSKNCRVTVFVNSAPYYQSFPSSKGSDDTYLGKKVHVIGIPSTSAGHKVDIYFMPVTDYDASLIETVYGGNQNLLINSYLEENIDRLLIAVIIFAAGVTLMIIGITNHSRRDGQSKFYFGLFSMCFATFSITHLNILTLFFDCSVFLYELEFLTLALLPYPAVCYIMIDNGVLPTLRHNLVKAVPVLNFFFVLFMHWTGWMPLNQTRPATLCMIVYFSVVIFYYLIAKQIREKPWRNLKKNWIDYIYFAFLISCIVEFALFHAGLIDSFLVISHYLLLIILTTQIVHYARTAQKLIAIGSKAKHLEDAAFFDSLTGLRNRTSLNQDIEKMEHNLTPNSSIAIIQLDINYLKRTNDILGHIAGDRLLKNAALAIRSGFADYGKCYRFGGDEFVVILEGNPKEKYNLGISAMESACDKINKTLQQLEHVSIAYGIAYYDPESDTSLWRVQERADVVMYERKRAMKQKKASNNKYQDDRL